jgi:hypothetical protein
VPPPPEPRSWRCSEGRWLYFGERAVAAAIAVPAAGWTIDLAGSYRALLAGGGAVALLALFPLARLTGERAELRRPSLRRAALMLGGLGGLCALLLAVAVAVERTRIAHAEHEVFEVLYGLGGTPEVLDRILVDPHIQNYAY